LKNFRNQVPQERSRFCKKSFRGLGCFPNKFARVYGHEYCLPGMFINFTFADHGVRFIAINDNYDTIDPNSIDNDFAGIKNWFNEFYARDTSRKIRAVQKAKGERGDRLTVNVPYGYRKNPDNPKEWIIDEEAAQVVKKISDLCMQGRGPSQIAAQLESEQDPQPHRLQTARGAEHTESDP